ncbi:hypothetical protein LRD69_20425 [Streptomyces sp. JH14]|uniref:hypothetical protein n=1 Tax=Streptomyces sp. JH14 TaxID=2793630 RepID=UPI0023F6440B|nr:hypothetical protein [Streptomyces sp. JH14]MDF6044462.1 hypothetical protein [Streptomyces sp. JH14]
MARHALSGSRRRVLLRAGLTVTAVGAAFGAGGAAAQAAPLPNALPSGAGSGLGAPSEGPGGAVAGALGSTVSPVTTLQPDPPAKTGVDPLANGVGTQVADFEPLSTAIVTDPLTSGGALQDLAPVGRATGLLHG